MIVPYVNRSKLTKEALQKRATWERSTSDRSAVVTYKIRNKDGFLIGTAVNEGQAELIVRALNLNEGYLARFLALVKSVQIACHCKKQRCFHCTARSIIRDMGPL